MRCNQVTIKIERFGECCPKEYPNDTQEIIVYCDSHDNIYEALSKAYSKCIDKLNEYEKIGVSCDVTTNEKNKTKVSK